MTGAREEIKLVIPWSEAQIGNPEPLLEREWLVTNGLGGYASGTLSGVITRRYHGLLIAALPSPLGRVVMLNSLQERLSFPDGTNIQLMGEERKDCALQMHGSCFLTDFSLEMGLPVWRYQIKSALFERRIIMRYRQNTVQVSYKLSGSTPVKLDLRPALHYRLHDEPLDISSPLPAYYITLADEFYEIAGAPGFPVLRMTIVGGDAHFIADRMVVEEYIYREEENRGYEGRENLWSPGYFHIDLSPGDRVEMIASTEPPETIRALSPAGASIAEAWRRQLLLGIARPETRCTHGAELVLAADQCVVTPVTRPRDTVRIHAVGDEIQTLIAVYHWFTDWGRDTMISLEGLTLLTGRQAEAGWILRTFGNYIQNGLIPNMFPEGAEDARYNTADATLWFFHAMSRYVAYSGHRTTLRIQLPRLLEIIDYHLRGTMYDIGVDPADGLLKQGAEGYALTWMDAKVGDLVVTPRRGKAVEINALWYNALRLAEKWCREENRGKDADTLAKHAEKARNSFNRRFWYDAGGYLYDVVDGPRGDDASCRPNQVFAISLDYPVLAPERWDPVLKVVKERLLTPVGLRSLAPGEPDYRPKYFGDLRSRDNAYHQGTVWAWLIGPFIDAWVRAYPDDRSGAQRFLEGLIPHLTEAGVGSISEVFDAEPPFTPRGCIAQAWSVAEFLRSWVKTSQENELPQK